MRICLIGEYSGNLDEGMKNVAFYIAKESSKYHEIMKLDTRKILSIDFWRKVKKFDPQIIHYIHGRTIKSLVILKALAYLTNAKTIMSTLHSDITSIPKGVVSLFKPDLVLVQDYEVEKMFRDLGCETEFLPNGVDIEKFSPISKNVKEKLREKYGISKEKFVVLHVGHIIGARNLQIFDRIQGGNNQVVIIGSTYRKMNHTIYKNLKERGCIIWRDYFKNIEEIYGLSDCYIFPVMKGYSILSPLSILEAMACNLPVITTKFGGLIRVFKEGDGLTFAEKEKDFINSINKCKSSDIQIKNRENVLPYSWENIAKRLDTIYSEVING